MKAIDVNVTIVKSLKTGSRRNINTITKFTTFLITLISVFFIILAQSSAIGQSPTTTDNSSSPIYAPLNPAFIQYINNLQNHNVSTTSVSDEGLGLIPSPLDFSYMKGAEISFPNNVYSQQNIPSYFDLRPSYVTSIKNQGPYGTCWAHATFASLESTTLKSGGGVQDYSESNLAHRAGWDYGWNDGGYMMQSTAYLTRWDGPLNESNDPYSNVAYIGPHPTNPVVGHEQEVLWLPSRNSSLDNNNIKLALMNYGAIDVCIYWAGSYYNDTYGSYYYPYYSYPNHAVDIVGWDDNYPASNFYIPPPGNGAFIVRNSWGSSFADGGYFYVSYYDGSAMNNGELAVFQPLESISNYDHIYQYDPLGCVDSFGYPNHNDWFSNVYTASTSESLKSVGFYSLNPNEQYTISIYTDPTTSNPASGSFVASTSGIMAIPGYHTISIPGNGVSLIKGQKFSIVVQATSTYYNIPLEAPLINYMGGFIGGTSKATGAPGQGFVSNDGSHWSDITTQIDTQGIIDYTNTSICLKAFTDDAQSPVNPLVAGFASNVTSGTAPLTVQFNDNSSGDPQTWQWDFGDGTGNAFTNNVIHSFQSPGNYNITLTVTNGSLSSSISNWIIVTTPLGPVVGLSTIWTNTSWVGLNNSIKLNYTLTNANNNYVYLRVNNSNNSIIQTTVAGPQNNGNNNISWNGCYDNGTRMPEGAYMLKVHVAKNDKLSNQLVEQRLLFNRSWGVAVDTHGNVYVADTGNNAVKMIFPNNVITLGSGFNQPQGVAADSQGNVYVADTGNNMVKKISANGGITSMGSGFNQPWGVTVDSQGNVYVADTYNNAIVEIYADGGMIQLGSGFSYPTGVAVDSYGDVYVADYGNSAVKEIIKGTTTPQVIATGFYPYGVAVDSNGTIYSADLTDNIVYRITSNGKTTLDSNFNGPGNVAVDSQGNVYVADVYNNTVKKIIIDNSSIGSGYNQPWGVAVDSQGNVYVADSYNNVVKEINAGGGTSTLASGFNNPYGIALDSQGNVYVADSRNNIVKEIYKNGTINTLASGFNFPQGVAVDTYGNVYVADTWHNAVKKISHGTVTTIGDSSKFNYPWGVAVDSHGNVYVANHVNVLGTSGIYIIYANNGSTQLLYSGFNPGGIALDPQNNIYTTDWTNGIAYRISADSTVTTLGTGFKKPAGIAVDARGNVYLADTNNNAVIKTYDNYSNLPLGYSFATPWGITVDKQGNIYLADWFGNAVKKISPDGTVSSVGSGFNSPNYVAVDTSGNVYVSDSGNHAVKKVYPSGTIVSVGSGFVYPGGLAVDPQGNVYVSDIGNSTVKKISPDGTTTPLGTGLSIPIDVAVDSQGNVFVVDDGDNMTKKISPNGTTTTIASGFNNPDGIAVDSLGNVYVSDWGNNAVDLVYPDKAKITLDNGFIEPRGLAIDSTGDLYIVDNNAISKFDTSPISSVPIDVGVDITPPKTSCQLSGINTTGGYIGNVTITLNATDAGAGVNATWYNLDNGTWNYYQTPFNVTTIGNHTLYYYSVDNATNIEALNSTSFGLFIAVKANFTSNATYGIAPLTVQFNDTSTGYPQSWLWNFGDGSQNATVQNVSHTFQSVGTYNVVLTVTNGTQSNSTISQITVIQPLVAGFTSNVTSGVAVLTVQFNDTSSGYPQTWQWNFGDNTGNVTSQNVSHTFSLAGTYNVVLTVTNGTRTSSTSGQITVIQPLVSQFKSNINSGVAPLTVQFNDTSTGFPQSWQWNFGDGSQNATVQNVSHTFQSAGTYNVVLTVANGTRISTASSQIIVTTPLVPNAAIVSYNIPSSMTSGQSYSCSVTVKNTGNKSWTNVDSIGLGAVYDSAGSAAKFGPTRFYLPSAVTVNPGSSYMFNFTLTAPSAGTYYPGWQMVWDGHQWFGQQLVITVNVAAAQLTPNAAIVSYNIPGSMVSGQSYQCSVTMKNTGTKSWTSSDAIGLGALYDSAGSASKFGSTRFYVPSGTTVNPGASYTFGFTLTAPSAGTYYPGWQMVWDGHQWFGQQLVITVNVAAAQLTPNAQIVSYSIPGSMTHNQSYICSVTVKNTGTKSWSSGDLIALGAVYDSAGTAAKFGSTRFYVPSGVTVSPSSQYTFNMTLTAPAAGTYYPGWQMVWDGHQWFGQQLVITVNVQ